jgi:hypothetical protein
MDGGEMEMLEWLVKWGPGGRFCGDEVRWVENGKELGLGRLVEGRGGETGERGVCRVLDITGSRLEEGAGKVAGRGSSSDSKASGRIASAVAACASSRAAARERGGEVGQREGVGGLGEFGSVREWIDYVKVRRRGDSGAQGGGGQSRSREGGSPEGKQIWDCLYVGAWSLREHAEGLSIEVVDSGEEGSERTGVMASDGIEVGEGDGAIGRDERVRLAMQVRMNELELLERTAVWLQMAAQHADGKA